MQPVDFNELRGDILVPRVTYKPIEELSPDDVEDILDQIPLPSLEKVSETGT